MEASHCKFFIWPERIAPGRKGRGMRTKFKGLAACNLQTTSPFSCLSNCSLKILSNFLGLLQILCNKRLLYNWLRDSTKFFMYKGKYSHNANHLNHKKFYLGIEIVVKNWFLFSSKYRISAPL